MDTIFCAHKINNPGGFKSRREEVRLRDLKLDSEEACLMCSGSSFHSFGRQQRMFGPLWASSWWEPSGAACQPT